MAAINIHINTKDQKTNSKSLLHLKPIQVDEFPIIAMSSFAFSVHSLNILNLHLFHPQKHVAIIEHDAYARIIIAQWSIRHCGCQPKKKPKRHFGGNEK